MSRLPLPNIPYSPITTESGDMKVEWQNFFKSLHVRVGGEDAPTLSDINSDIRDYIDELMISTPFTP